MGSKLFLCVLLAFVCSAIGCGYDSCPTSYDPHKTYLHIIAHSHDDVGWLETPDHYAENDVSPMLSAVVAELQKNKQRKFVEVEMYFFKRWWQRQTLAEKANVRELVKSGQLTFANGGWCINDEATTHYNQIIDQMTLGIDFLRQEFGECAVPKLSWQIDPFGASREQANLFAMMGFDAHVTNRGNNQLRGEFMWNTSLGHEIFTTHLHAHYSAPDGYNFEDGHKNEVTTSNQDSKAKHIADIGRSWNRAYGSKGHVLITFGDDFQYKNAGSWFRNLDKLVELVNKVNPDLHLMYSSPQCYVKAIRDQKHKLEVKSGDFHPYWTGYYASRPVVKYLDRYVNNLLQAAKQLEVFSELGNTQGLIDEAKNEMGILQHHDAVSGTSPSHIMDEYKLRLYSAIKALQSAQSQSLSKLTSKASSFDPTTAQKPYIFTSGNISDFVHHPDKNSFAAVLYNPLAQAVKSWIRVPVSEEHGFKIVDSEGKEVKGINVVPIAEKVKSLIGHHKQITHELVFEAQLPALGFTTYFVTKEAAKLIENKHELAVNGEKDFVLKGKNFELVVNHVTGKIQEIVKNGQKHRLSQSYAYYRGKSDAYEFCPHGPAEDLSVASPMKVTHAAQYEGYSEVTGMVNNWVSQTVRVYADREYAELDWVVGPIGEDDKKSKEVVVRFETDLKSQKTFYTDSNGRQNMKRERTEETRECHGQHQKITYNYYPVTTHAILRDEASKDFELLLIPDRSVGAASLHDGQIELMIHRRCFAEDGLWIVTDDKDSDAKGVVTRGKILLFLNDLKQDSAADLERDASRAIFMQPVVSFYPLDTVDQYTKSHNIHYTALKSALPDNIHLLTVENWGPAKNNEVLVRFENFYQPDDQSKRAVEAKFSLENLFAGLVIESVEKTNLVGGNRVAVSGKEISLRPQEIDTYILKVKRTVANLGCGFKWAKLGADGALPAHAIVAGYEADQSPLYICRHKNQDLIPGKYSPGIHCHVSYGGGEIAFDDPDVEILTAEHANYQWAPRHGGDAFPDSAFVAGQKGNGVPLYVGRCHKNGLVVGKIDEHFYYPYANTENQDRECLDHEVLTC